MQTADIDADSISTSYSWTLDGQLVGFTNNVIPTSQISDGEMWECTVVADDGTDLSPPVTASTVIGANVEAAVGQQRSDHTERADAISMHDVEAGLLPSHVPFADDCGDV